MKFTEKLKRHDTKWCVIHLERSLCTCPDIFHKDEKHLIGKVHVHEDFISLQLLDNCWINIREDLIQAFEKCLDQDELSRELSKSIQRAKMHVVPKKPEKIIIDGDGL